MKELKFVSRYVKRHGLQYILGIVALFAVDLMNVYIPQYTGEITDGLEARTLEMDGVIRLILRILILGAIVALGRFFWRYFIFGASRSIEKEMRNDLFAHLEKLSMRYYNEHKTGDLMAHFTNDLQSIRMFLGPTVITAFDATVMLVLVLGQMILYVDMKLTLVAVLPLILIIFGDYFYGKLMHRRFIRKQKAFSDLTDQVQEAVSGIRVIKAFVQEHKELAAFAVTNKVNQEKNLSVVRLQAGSGSDCRRQQSADPALRRIPCHQRYDQPWAVCGVQFLYRHAGVADDRSRRLYHLCISGTGLPETYYGDL